MVVVSRELVVVPPEVSKMFQPGYASCNESEYMVDKLNIGS